MAKFFDNVGYGITEETRPGVWVDVIVEKPYYGDVTRNSRTLTEGSSVNDDLSLNNSVSIVADAYLTTSFHAIRYVRWLGGVWNVKKVEVDGRRLILRLGGVYNGQTADSTVPV